MKKDEKIQENNARHAGETHNNNSPAFSAYGFTCTGMNIFGWKMESARFPVGKWHFLGPVAMTRTWPLH